MKYRAYQDRKGTLFAEVRMNGETFALRYSTAHAKRIDVFWNGRKAVTTRLGMVFSEISTLLT